MTFRESSTSFAGTTGVERFPRIGFLVRLSPSSARLS